MTAARRSCALKGAVMRVLCINPGSTSTKLGLFEGEKVVFKETLNHGAEDLAGYASCYEQLGYRKERVVSFLWAQKGESVIVRALLEMMNSSGGTFSILT